MNDAKTTPAKLTILLPAMLRACTDVLARCCAIGDRSADAALGRDAMLRECFGVSASPPPIAALTRSLDAADAANAQWLRADPAFVMADALTLRLMQCGKMDLSKDEVEAFAATLKPLFGDAGFGFDAPNPERWYLRCACETKLPNFSAPSAALGDDLARHLPQSENAQHWRSLLNDVQIVLTQHPLNAHRLQRGQLPVNSLWFWGGGQLPESIRCDFTEAFSNDDIVIALARLAKIPTFQLMPKFSSTFFDEQQNLDSSFRRNGENRSILIDLVHVHDPAQLEQDWLAPIGAALRKRKIDMLHLLFESGERYVVRPAHRWRFWRRTKLPT